MGNSDYLFVLQAIKEIPFNVGKNLLIDFLTGNLNNKSVKNNKLDKLDSFGTLGYDKFELEDLINSLVSQGFISFEFLDGKKFWKVMFLTQKGLDEIKNPSSFKKQAENKETNFTKEEETLMTSLGFFLDEFNDGQKKVIISNKKEILCVAGAGSGKTTVLTKRIEFLVKYKSVNPKKILAITFTRKARQQMIEKLEELDIKTCKVETFNSFCEKILRKHENLIYNKDMRVVSYKDKIYVVNKALAALNLSMKQAIKIYFSDAQIRNKSPEKLANVFLNDCFFVRDYLKSKNEEINNITHQSNIISKDSYDLVFGITKYIEAYLHKSGLRDYMDQILDAINFFKNNKEHIPEFEHILVDEYQDVNSLQIELLDFLIQQNQANNSNNIFCVGDPRQSIFGWRGSDIKYITTFKEKYAEAEIVMLTENYRSDKKIVDLMNETIKTMQLPNLNSDTKNGAIIKLLNFNNEQLEYSFIAQSILSSNSRKDEIFVLARMNKQLKEISDQFKINNIPFILKDDDSPTEIEEHTGKVVLATVHSIKGLEAETVYVAGCSSMYFPCKTSDHPFLEMIKLEEYNKHEEERRLFYVAISRAKQRLILTYSGKYASSFITKRMKHLLEYDDSDNSKQDKIAISKSPLFERLKDWRIQKARELDTKPFLILHDSSLIDLIEKKPSTLEELRTVKGFAVTKIAKYGDEILDVLLG